MKRAIILNLLLIITAMPLFSQMKQNDPTVFIFVEDSMYAMREVTTQTEMKRGIDIQGITVGRKLRRYIYGASAKQESTSQPRFAIYPTTQNLNDYVLVRLKERKDYRLLPMPQLVDCDYIRVELKNFKIENLPNMGFAVTPLSSLFPGEYILTDITQEPCNQYGDFKAYDFKVIEE